MEKVKKVCATCGSDQILADSYSEWNMSRQEWETISVMDKGHYCTECDDDCNIDEEVVDEDT